MRNLKLAVARTPILGRFLLILYRAHLAFAYLRIPLWHALIWLFTSKETTNYSYDLDDINKRHLASLIADITREKFDVVMAYIREAETDVTLRAHIVAATTRSDLAFIADNEVRFGRRVGWYALVRILKPKIVIETGVDKGLGACLLTAAIKKNAEDGHQGRYYGTDINPSAGYLLSGDYARFGSILYGDSIESLKQIEGLIDLFINDSDHSADYEAREYMTVANKLTRHAVVIGDNSHSTNALLEFSLKMGRHFVFFQEKPRKHWYPGGGIGVSFNR